MNIGDLLANDGIIPALAATDKKSALRQLADHASKTANIDAKEVFNALLQRERLSSTSLGRGIAIPHIKLPETKAISCYFARLEKPIAFESHDGEPVDLLFFLLAPEHAGEDHLKALARISRLVRDPQMLHQLRSAKDADALKRVLTAATVSNAA